VSGRYLTASRLAQLERTLSDRDRAIVDTLDQLRVATTRQLRRLHFADLTPASAARQTPKVLRRLTAQRVVTQLDRQLGGVRAGSAATVWALDVAGQRLAAATGPAGGPMRRPWTPGLAFVAHRLAVSELYVELVEAERAGGCRLLEFAAEPLSWRHFSAPYGGTAILKPDAFVRLRTGDYERGAFVEVDRATESAAVLRRKCCVYRRYWETGREQERRGYFPDVVFAVPDETRREVVLDVAARQPEESWPLYRVVLTADAPASIVAGRTP
jgi:hypothetical protein